MAQDQERPINFEQAKARYPNRYTMEHVPNWAVKERSDGTFYAPQYRTDREWYDNTLFPGEKDWDPEDRATCCSLRQSWPLGMWLRKGPYSAATMGYGQRRISALRKLLGGTDGE